MLDSINRLLSGELAFFENYFKNSIKSKVALLDTIMLYILKRKGKKIRPLFVFLIANMAGKIQEKTYRAAALIELLHTATLVHDDVVDETLERRGAFSINALWKNKVAVLVGDYLLSKGLLISLENEDFDILKIVSTAVKKMSEGELLQLEKSRTLNLNEDTYFKIIQYKTASLLSAACAVGASSVTDNIALIDDMKLLGENIGIAFQLKDDLLDYSNQKIGKPTYNDLKEKKYTLPLIYTLKKINYFEKKEIIFIIKNKNKSSAQLQKIISLVNKYDGLQYTEQKMNEYKNNALSIIHKYPKTNYTMALIDLIEFTTNRKY